MWNLKSVFVVLLAGLSLIGVAAARLPAQAGNTWTVHYGDPGRAGTHKTTIKISYIDAQGVKQEKSIAASISLAANDSANSKKTAAQDAMNAELSKEENKVGGQPLASTSGGGNAMTITPAPNSGSGFSDAQIEEVKSEDKQTGEKDEIFKPKKKGLAQVSPQGELLGQTSDRGPSVFFVTTNLGTASVQLTGSMTKLALLEKLKEGLVAQDPKVVVWVDSELEILFVKLVDGDEGIFSIGAGSTDEGLTAVCRVLVTD